MSNGRSFYPCKCGGEICEEWDSCEEYISCDSCDNPIPADCIDNTPNNVSIDNNNGKVEELKEIKMEFEFFSRNKSGIVYGHKC